jgi:hypothetical protein
MGRGSRVPRILNLGAWRTLAVTFAPWPHYSWCPKLYKKLGGPKKEYGRSGNEKTMLLRLGIFGPSTRSIVLIMTEEFVVDLGSFQRERRSPLVIRNWRIPVKNTIGWSRVAFCTYEIIHLMLKWPCIVISFVQNNQLDASNIQNLFCHETLHVSGIFCAHHQELSLYTWRLVRFML